MSVAFLKKLNNARSTWWKTPIKQLLKQNGQKTRFALIGVINTALDFSIFLVLSFFGMPVVAANFISTSVALLFSFTANRKYTFPNNTQSVQRSLVLFLIVTCFALWVLQPVVILSLKALLQNYVSTDNLVVLFAIKLVATVFSLVWNFILYKAVVFKER